jgi:hypothetical protein
MKLTVIVTNIKTDLTVIVVVSWNSQLRLALQFLVNFLTRHATRKKIINLKQ